MERGKHLTVPLRNRHCLCLNQYLIWKEKLSFLFPFDHIVFRAWYSVKYFAHYSWGSLFKPISPFCYFESTKSFTFKNSDEWMKWIVWGTAGYFNKKSLVRNVTKILRPHSFILPHPLQDFHQTLCRFVNAILKISLPLIWLFLIVLRFLKMIRYYFVRYAKVEDRALIYLLISILPRSLHHSLKCQHIEYRILNLQFMKWTPNPAALYSCVSVRQVVNIILFRDRK